MKQLYSVLSALNISLLAVPSVARAQDTAETSCDIRVVNVTSISATASTNYLVTPRLSYPLTVTLGNGGKTVVEGASLVVSLDGNELFTEKVTTPITTGFKVTTVTLSQGVEFQPGKKNTLSLTLLPPEGMTDTNEANNKLTKEYNTPALGEYPYEWSASTAPGMFTSVSSTGGYKYSADDDAFTCSGTGNWSNHYLFTRAINVPKGEKAKLQLKYKVTAGDGFTFDPSAIGVDGTVALSKTELAAGADGYTVVNVPFEGNGLTVLKIHATPKNTRVTNGLSLTGISVVADQPDMACAAILSPVSPNYAIGSSIQVKVKFTNPTGLEIVDPKVWYTFGDTKVEETLTGTIAVGASVDYTFAAPLAVSEAAKGTLSVGCSFTGDTNAANDTQTMELNFYAPFAFPYSTDFSNLDGWTIVDADANTFTWTPGTIAGDTENGVLCYPMFMSAPKDYAYTPAISMPAGKSRISFYIGGALGSKVNVLMGKSMDPAEMTVVAGGEVAIDGWFTIANTIDIPEAGVYYFAFDCVTARGEVFVDNLYIDRGNDLGVNALTFDTATGFKKTVSKVTMSITNFGIDAQSGITIACFVNDGTSKEFIKHDEAVIDATIQPGETYYHTFDKPVDISTPGKTYTLMGEIITKVGSDTQNDKSLGQALTHYAVQEVPYRNGFEDTDRNAQWTMLTADGSNGWMISRQIGNTYEGNFILGHTSVNATAAANDWAFSECIHIPAGTYEFAMFYRTFKNMTADNYKQNFKVMLGKDATVSAMSQTIVDMKDVIVSGAVCEKYVSAITVAEEGDYYIGFYSDSPMGRGVTYLDAVSIVPVAAGRECAYEADFADAPDEWDVYYTTMNSWTYNAADGAMVMNRNAYYAAMVGSAGWLVSPKLSFEGAQAHEVTFEYSLTGDAADSPALGIYVGAVNNPSDFVLVKSFEPAEAFTEGKCVIPALEEAADRYVAIRPTMESAKKGYVAKVKSFKVAHSSTSGIENIGLEGVDAAVSEVARYDVNGRPVTAAYKGFTIVRLSDGSVRKVFVK